ncbi:MAG: glycosyltransferase family 39 protein [Rubrivivax sp.]|nr:glycosyltransferase family 39 protein [Rubrivivax sp.]
MLPDEGRYVGVAWEMLQSGDWLTPTLDGLPYFHKPPLFYWITAASLKLLGVHLLASRLAPLLGAWVAAMALYAFARRWWDERSARTALAVLLAQPLFYGGSQFANLDMLVAGCITLTIVLLAHGALAFERDGRVPRAALLGGYAAAAFGVLAKGLIGIVIPTAVIGLWLLGRRRGRTLRALLSWRGALVFAALVAPWFIAMSRLHPGFAEYFFVVQHFKRYASAGFNNIQPLWFYAALLGLCTLPWLAWARPALKHAWWTAPGRSAQRRLLLSWLGFTLVFFSLPRSKLAGYILPAVPALMLLLADAWCSRHPAGVARSASRAWPATALGAVIGLGVVGWIALHPARTSAELAQVLREHRLPGEPVWLLEGYPFDLRLLASLEAPVPVVDRWSLPQTRARDDWRRELVDAAGFAPRRAQDVLVEPAELAARLCRRAVNWVVADEDVAWKYPFLRRAQVLASVRQQTLWRVDTASPALRAALNCAGTPSAGSAGR